MARIDKPRLAMRLRIALAHSELDQREVARRANIHEQVITDILGARRPGIRSLPKIAKILGVSPLWLAHGGSDAPDWATGSRLMEMAADEAELARSRKSAGDMASEAAAINTSASATFSAMLAPLPSGLNAFEHLAVIDAIDRLIDLKLLKAETSDLLKSAREKLARQAVPFLKQTRGSMDRLLRVAEEIDREEGRDPGSQ